MPSAVPGGDAAGRTGASRERPAQTPDAVLPQRRRRGRWGHTYAALDLGTNNCRLLVARPTRGGFRVIDAFSRIVRLGEGLAGAGTLSPAAQERTIAALRICAQKMDRRGVTRRRLVATDACRRASNGIEFLARVAEETGLELEILSTADEATLAVAGCAPLIDRRARHALVFDIGGGSTELTWVQVRRGGRTRVLDWTSLPCGVVNLAERYGGEAVAPEVYEAMIGEVVDRLAPFRDGIGRQVPGRPGQVQMLGTSGTVTTLGGVQLDLPYYDRNQVDGLWLDFDDALGIAERLRAMSFDERAAHPCIGRERADLVVAGCAILAAICRAWPLGRLRVADRGLREGMLLAMMRAADHETS